MVRDVQEVGEGLSCSADMVRGADNNLVSCRSDNYRSETFWQRTLYAVEAPRTSYVRGVDGPRLQQRNPGFTDLCTRRGEFALMGDK